MLTTRVGLSVGLLAASILVAGAGTAPPDDECTSRSCGGDDGGSDAGASDGTLAITVWGSGTTNGDTGGFEVPLETVWVHPTCWYWECPTGAEYAEYVESG